MKSKLLIILLLIVSLLSAFCATSQDSTTFRGGCGSVTILIPYNKPRLIADETYITYTKTGAFITTYSESIFNELCGRFINKFTKVKRKCTFLSFKWKGRYKMYLSLENAIMISNWSRLHL